MLKRQVRMNMLKYVFGRYTIDLQRQIWGNLDLGCPLGTHWTHWDTHSEK